MTSTERRAELRNVLEQLVNLLIPEEQPVFEPEKDVFKDILREGARYFGITEEVLISDERHPNTISARHVVFYLIREELGWSFPEIGNRCGYDHTTILAAYRKIENIVKDPSDVRYKGTMKAVETIKERVGS